MKKYKEWLTNEIEIMESETSENYPHEQMVEREVVLNLINQLDEPEKVVIPQFVADWWERDSDSVTMYEGVRIEKKHKLNLVSYFQDRGLIDSLSKVEYWLDENDSIFLDLVNGKPYEVEKEQKYIIEVSDGLYLSQPLGDTSNNEIVMTWSKEQAYKFKDEESIEGHLLKFKGSMAKPVEELEE